MSKSVMRTQKTCPVKQSLETDSSCIKLDDSSGIQMRTQMMLTTMVTKNDSKIRLWSLKFVATNFLGQDLTVKLR